MRPLCCGNSRKSATAGIRHPGHMATWPPSTWLQSLPLFVSIGPCSMPKVHMCFHQSGHQPLSNRPSFCQPPVMLCLLPSLPFLHLCLSRSYTPFKTQLEYAFFQNALQLQSAMHLSDLSAVTLSLYLGFRTLNGPSKLCLGQYPPCFPPPSMCREE